VTTGHDLPGHWETSSSERTAETSPAELTTLTEQLAECKSMPGKVFALRCFAEAFHGYTAGHFVTTVVVAAILLGVALLAL
jgi:FAD synthase